MPLTASAELERIALRGCIPLTVQLELTAHCNHACTFCYKPTAPRAEELQTGEVLELLDTLARMGALYLQLTGGEPTLRPDFRAIAERARDNHFALSLSTNGSTLDQETASWIAALPFASVQISLLAAGPGLHDQLVRSPGSFERVVAAARFLKSEAVDVTLVCTVVEENAAELDSLLALGESLGVPVRFDPRCQQPRRYGAQGQWKGPDRRILKQVLTRPDVTPDFLDDPDKVPTQPGQSICAAGRTRMRIDERGQVFACSFMPLPLGNVREGLERVWREAPALEELRRLTFDHTNCTGCDLVQDCAPCPGRHLEDTGDLLTPSPTVCWEAALRRKVKRDRG